MSQPKPVLILGGYVTAHITPYRSFKNDYESIRLRNQIREWTGAEVDTEEWLIVSGYASRYADCVVYTHSLVFHGDYVEFPEPIKQLHDFWDRVKAGAGDEELWQRFSEINNTIIMGSGTRIKGWAQAIDEAQTIWKPRDEKMVNDNDTDFLSPSTEPNNTNL